LILKTIEEILQEYKHHAVTSSIIRGELVKRLPDIKIPVGYSIRRYMKKYLKVTYHKANHIFDPNPLGVSIALKL